MGAAGIKRRKRKRRLPDVGDIAEGDQARLFGRFTWNQYSPAGNLERSGFLARQFNRNGFRGVGSFLWQARWMFLVVPAGIVAVGLALHFIGWT
jgi:hypothetical protein